MTCQAVPLQAQSMLSNHLDHDPPSRPDATPVLNLWGRTPGHVVSLQHVHSESVHVHSESVHVHGPASTNYGNKPGVAAVSCSAHLHQNSLTLTLTLTPSDAAASSRDGSI
ncbi:unnamed protein product [Pleuronectes platessa]|uniref:Uncharacterized protein n=1 Tax=Pleuronectes platessa TaxID=8262 RepID=A0A9N7UCE0_PLEPL|nr:unnamed protein product [Pleuronectes platessa]